MSECHWENVFIIMEDVGMTAVSYLVSEGGICELKGALGMLNFVSRSRGVDMRILNGGETLDSLSEYLVKEHGVGTCKNAVIVFFMVMSQGVFVSAVRVGDTGVQVMQQFYGPGDHFGEVMASVESFAGSEGRRIFLFPDKHTRGRLPEGHLGRLCHAERIRRFCPGSSCVCLDRLSGMILSRTGRVLGRDVMRRLEYMRLGVSSFSSSRGNRCVEDGLLYHAARRDALDVLKSFCSAA